MPLSRDSRQERKLKAVRRAEFRLLQSIQRIDWEEDVLMPEIEALKSGKAVLGLPDGMAFDIQVEPHENTRHTEADDRGESGQSDHRPAARARRAKSAPARARFRH